MGAYVRINFAILFLIDLYWSPSPVLWTLIHHKWHSSRVPQTRRSRPTLLHLLPDQVLKASQNYLGITDQRAKNRLPREKEHQCSEQAVERAELLRLPIKRTTRPSQKTPVEWSHALTRRKGESVIRSKNEPGQSRSPPCSRPPRLNRPEEVSGPFMAKFQYHSPRNPYPKYIIYTIVLPIKSLFAYLTTGWIWID